MLNQRMISLRLMPVLVVFGAVAFAADDPVVQKAKEGTKVAVEKTRQGGIETAKAVRTAAEWVKGDRLRPSVGDIAKAQREGKVWADHETWVYHKDGDKYGRTPNGEFWSEADAKAAGYKLAATESAEKAGN